MINRILPATVNVDSYFVWYFYCIYFAIFVWYSIPEKRDFQINLIYW